MSKISKSKFKKVAVCIASYNMAHFLLELFSSLEKQTFKDFSVYLSYNGSTDNTLDIIKKSSLDIKVVPYKKTPGIGLNKHDVVKLALQYNPKYVQMIDADDLILPTFLETVVSRLDKDDVDWVVCWGKLFGDREGYVHSEIPTLEELLQNNNKLHSWGTFKYNVLKHHNYNPKIIYAEDWDLWIRLYKSGYKGDIVKEELYQKRWHDTNLTSTHDEFFGEKLKIPNKKFRFHILGYVHLPCSREYMGCAFTQKNYKLSEMLLSLGHEVYYYGSEGSTVPCTELIETHTLQEIKKTWGDGDNRFDIGYDWHNSEFRHDFNKERTPLTLKFYNECTRQINARKKQDDFLLIMQGHYHKPISDSVKLFLTCEPGIGYRGSIKGIFRAFESAYIQNFTYGSEEPYASRNGSYYDRVIPNYFDSQDFEFSENKEDYYVYIGRMIIRKGIMTAYLTTQAIGAKLIIAGQGAHVDRRGYLVPNENPDFELPPGNWEYVGYVNTEQRKKLLSKATATFVPTIYLEPFAGTHIESILSGTPVLTTSFGVFPGTFQDGIEGYHCNTLDDFVWAAKKCKELNPQIILKNAERYLMDNVKWEYQRWFDDLYQVYLSATMPNTKGWHHIRDEEPEWRNKI